MAEDFREELERWRTRHPEKFVSESRIFRNIRRGARIFVSTACGEPQYLAGALIKFVESEPKAFCDAEIFQVWTMGVSPYTDVKFKDKFRHNSVFVGMNTRDVVNDGLADFTPVFLSQTPNLFRRKIVALDVALVQASPPDRHGYMSLGISVDISKAAIEAASCVIVQVNSHMPRVHGETFINIKEVDYVIGHDEPLLEFRTAVSDEIAQRIGKFVSRIVGDGDTIQVGYGSVPNAILSALENKKHLGVHTELFTDGITELMKKGVVDNTRKTLRPGKTVASFCMGSRETYEFIHDNPAVEFLPIDEVNSPVAIAGNRNMTAINSALEVDLTGQATAESLGKRFMSGIGGSTDFMRGAVLAPGGKTILVIQSTAAGGTVSRIVPFVREGAGVTLGRGDIHYLVTEYGIAYLYGKNIRERAMSIISIAHPKFRPWLMEMARENNLIYSDQAFIPGPRGEYPEELETTRRTRAGVEIKLRPVRIDDEPKLKDFFYSMSEQSMYRRFISQRYEMPHEALQDFVVVDNAMQVSLVAAVEEEGVETVAGLGQFIVSEETHTAEVALAVGDAWQNRGIGWELLNYLTHLAVKRGLQGFTAEVLVENHAMLHLFEKMKFSIKRKAEAGSYELEMQFRGHL